MNWSILKPIILSVVTRLIPFWGGLAATLLDKILPNSGNLGDAFKAKEAPDTLKALVKDFLLKSLDGLNRPILKRVLTQVIERLDGAIMDAIWDQLFAAKQVETLSAQHHTVAFTASDSVDVSELEAELKAEFGLAA